MECWQSQNSMADSSTTTAPILDLIAGGCWARRRLRPGIKNASVALELMKSLTIMGVVFLGPLALTKLDVRSLHDRWADPESDCGRFLGSTPATQRYMVRPEAPIPHRASIGFQEGGLLGGGGGKPDSDLDVNLPVY